MESTCKLWLLCRFVTVIATYSYVSRSMPLIPPTAELFDRNFVNREWEVVRTVIPPLSSPFKMQAACDLNDGMHHNLLTDSNNTCAACSRVGITGMCCPT